MSSRVCFSYYGIDFNSLIKINFLNPHSSSEDLNNTIPQKRAVFTGCNFSMAPTGPSKNTSNLRNFVSRSNNFLNPHSKSGQAHRWTSSSVDKFIGGQAHRHTSSSMDTLDFIDLCTMIPCIKCRQNMYTMMG